MNTPHLQPVDQLPLVEFTNPFIKITKIHVERVMNTDERTGKTYVAYHQFLAAEGIDARDGAEIDIDWTFNLRGTKIHAWNGFRITPREWKDDMIRFANAYHLKAVRMNLLDAKYEIHDGPASTPAAAANAVNDEIPF